MTVRGKRVQKDSHKPGDVASVCRSKQTGTWAKTQVEIGFSCSNCSEDTLR